MDVMKLLGGLLGGGLDGGGLFKAAPSGGGSLADALGGMLSGGSSSSGGGLAGALGGLLGGGSGGGGDVITSALSNLMGGGQSRSGGSSLMPLLSMALAAFMGNKGHSQATAGAASSQLFDAMADKPADQDAALDPRQSEDDAVLLIKSMIAAAYADGRLDETERQAITSRMESVGLDDDERAFIAEELLSPAKVDEIISGVKTRQQAWQVYAVSILGINVDTWEERSYLQELARGIGLSPEDRTEIKRQLGLA